jgi:hypothetical protein
LIQNGFLASFGKKKMSGRWQRGAAHGMMGGT